MLLSRLWLSLWNFGTFVTTTLLVRNFISDLVNINSTFVGLRNLISDLVHIYYIDNFAFHFLNDLVWYNNSSGENFCFGFGQYFIDKIYIQFNAKWETKVCSTFAVGFRLCVCADQICFVLSIYFLPILFTFSFTNPGY